MSDDQTTAHSNEYHSMSGRRVLRRIFGPTRDMVTGEWRKLHNEVLNDLYSSPYNSGDHIKKNEMGGACSTYGREERRTQDFGRET